MGAASATELPHGSGAEASRSGEGVLLTVESVSAIQARWSSRKGSPRRRRPYPLRPAATPRFAGTPRRCSFDRHAGSGVYDRSNPNASRLREAARLAKRRRISRVVLVYSLRLGVWILAVVLAFYLGGLSIGWFAEQ